MAKLTLDWTLRQPRYIDDPPCGCWDEYECECRTPVQEHWDRLDGLRKRGEPDPAFAARTRWLLHYGWIKTPPMENLVQILKAFYVTPMIEQLNRPVLLSALVAEKNELYRPGS